MRRREDGGRRSNEPGVAVRAEQACTEVERNRKLESSAAVVVVVVVGCGIKEREKKSATEKGGGGSIDSTRADISPSFLFFPSFLSFLSRLSARSHPTYLLSDNRERQDPLELTSASY